MADTPMTELAPTLAEPNGTRPLPTTIELDPAHLPRHTPREMQLVEAELGKPAGEMTVGEGEQAMAFFALRRLGYDPSWEQAGDVLVDQVTPGPPNGEPASDGTTSSPDSVGTGE